VPPEKRSLVEKLRRNKKYNGGVPQQRESPVREKTKERDADVKLTKSSGGYYVFMGGWGERGD